MALVVRWTPRESEIGVPVLGCPSMSHPTGCSGSNTVQPWVGQAGYFYCTKEVKQTDLNVQSKNRLYKNNKCCAHSIFKDIVQVTFLINIVPWTTYCDDIKPWVFGIVIPTTDTPDGANRNKDFATPFRECTEFRGVPCLSVVDTSLWTMCWSYMLLDSWFLCEGLRFQ